MFDRMDICNAYYVFGMLWHGGQGTREYGYLSRLARMGFKPGEQAQRGRLLDPGARAVYRELCKARGY